MGEWRLWKRIWRFRKKRFDSWSHSTRSIISLLLLFNMWLRIA